MATLLTTSEPTQAFNQAQQQTNHHSLRPVGGAGKPAYEGAIDVNVHFVGGFGMVLPTERATTFQPANISILTGGVGYTIGRVGWLKNLQVRIDGAYFNAPTEQVERADDDLPRGYRFFSADRGGYATATIAANLVQNESVSFGAFVQGTLPIDVDLHKFSSVRLHYGAGGAALGVRLTELSNFISLGLSSRFFIGSGAYADGYQHNAAAGVSNLLVVEAVRWVLPWRMGVSVGPYFESDLNESVNERYNSAYGSVSADLVSGDRTRSLRFALAVLPYFRVTENAAVELGYVQQLSGYDATATQFWSGGVRAQF